MSATILLYVTESQASLDHRTIRAANASIFNPHIARSESPYTRLYLEAALEQESIALGWGSLALINAALANIDRRGPLKYFLVSLLLGPFVTLLLAATRENDAGDLRQVDVWSGRDTVKR